MSDSESAEYKYWAFISYNKHDAKWARWLHRAIETYGIPAQLVSHPTPTGHPAPKRFQPLFRDREELPASSDLGTQVEGALRASHYLIIICSPHAASSKWVNKEIETFQTFGRQDRVLAMIVEGEPNAGDKRECFPPALRVHEPIAADGRAEGDGKTNAKLKLLAGMLGVSFDALRQRDAHRRIRRLQLAVAASLLVALSLAGLATYALSQRDRAVKARQQAESVLQFLVYDMRDELEKVGRLDLVDKIQKRVDQYERELGLVKSLPATFQNQAAALVNAGQLAFDKGDLADALKAYREASAMSQRLAATDLSNTDWQRELGVCQVKMGEVLVAQGDLTGALAAYQESLAIDERLAASDPSNSIWQRDLSVSRMKVSDVLRAQGDLAGALLAYREALALRQRLAAADPSNSDLQRDVSVTQQEIGDVLLARRDLTGALAAYRESLAVSRRLAAVDPSNARWQRDLSVSEERVGAALEDQGDLAGALAAYQESLALRQRLAAADPSNAGWQRDLSVGRENLGKVLSAQGDLAGAAQAYREALAISERLAAADPSNSIWQRDLSASRLKVGDALSAQGDLARALLAYREALALRQRLAAADPSNADWQRDLWAIYQRLAITLESQNNPEAREHWMHAYTNLAGLQKRGIHISPDDLRILEQLRQKVEGGAATNR